MDPKWCQNVTQDGSFHGTEDGVCGYLSDGVLLLDGPRSQYVKPCVLVGFKRVMRCCFRGTVGSF